jgi:large subunit ribosomal protein L15
VKVLARGDLDKALIVKAHAFSAAAKAKIEAAGGRAEVVG